jgi:hypothetical protein
MEYSKSLLILLYFLLFVGKVSFAQDTNCTIEFTTTVTEPQAGRSNGKIEFVFKDNEKKYTIYWINRSHSEAKNPIKVKEIKDLKAGFYDFVIVDAEGCSRQTTVILKGN